MPIITPENNDEIQTFVDPIVPVLYSEVKPPQQNWGSIGGVGTPDPYANVTGDHIFTQAAEPTPEEGAKEGDLWFDTNDDNHPYQLVDQVWTSVRDAGAGGTATPGTGKWAHDLVFSVTTYRKVAWGTGTITLPNGTTYSISAGDTGDMAATTYVYLDVGVSTTALQVTTTAGTAVGTNKILVAVAKNVADTAKDAEYIVFGGLGQSKLITADNIAANTITGDEIAANTITAGKMSVSTLSAIAADIGEVTAGILRSGQTAYNTGIGYWLGQVLGTAKFSIGNGVDQFMTWNGTEFAASGSLKSQEVITAGQNIDSGNVVAVETDGLLYRSRVTGLNSQNSPTTFSTTGSNTFTNKHTAIEVSATVKFFVMSTGGASEVLGVRAVVSQTASGIVSVSSASINATGSNINGADACLFDTNKVLLVYNESTSGALNAGVISGLDSGITTNTEATVDGSCYAPACVKRSSTSVLVFCTESADQNIKAFPLAISGTTITPGTVHEVAAHASDTYRCRSAARFGTSDYYCVAFTDITNSIHYAQIVQYDGSTWTNGTKVQIATGIPSTASQINLISISNDKVLCTYVATGGGGTAVFAVVLSRSGTTLTVQTPTTIQNGMASSTAIDQGFPTIQQLAAYTYVIGYEAAGAVTKLALVNVDGNTVDLITTGAGNSNDIVPAAMYLSPTRLLVCQSQSSTVGEVRTVDLTTNYDKIIGLAQSTVAEGASETVTLSGAQSGLTGLAAGTEYYADLDGGVATATEGGTKKIGVALSAVKLVVQI